MALDTTISVVAADTVAVVVFVEVVDDVFVGEQLGLRLAVVDSVDVVVATVDAVALVVVVVVSVVVALLVDVAVLVVVSVLVEVAVLVELDELVEVAVLVIDMQPLLMPPWLVPLESERIRAWLKSPSKPAWPSTSSPSIAGTTRSSRRSRRRRSVVLGRCRSLAAAA